MQSSNFYVHYEPPEAPGWTLKLNWEQTSDWTTEKLIETFCMKYNEKHPENILNERESAIFTSENEQVKEARKISEFASPCEDFFLKQVTVKKCTRLGCGKEYTEVNNKEGSCLYHSGNPVFHEGLKKWSCCSKKGFLDFDDFLQEPGCCKGHHISKTMKAANQVTKPKKPPVSKIQGVETYKTEGILPSSQYIIPPSDKKKQNLQKEEEPEEEDPPNAPISKGTKCTHHGCQKEFIDETSRTETCVYHPGIPIFHEGSKGWSCCKKKVLDFSDFLQIEGCKEGKHKFIPKQTDSNTITCKHDWYQSANKITLNIYAKKVSKHNSDVQIESEKVKVHLVFEDGKEFYKSFNLAKSISPEKSNFQFLSTKLEFQLQKKHGEAWDRLEF